MDEKVNPWMKLGFGCALISLAIFVIIEAVEMPPFVIQNKELPGPGFFPFIIGIILIAGGIYEILNPLVKKQLIISHKFSWNFIKDRGKQNIIIAILAIIFYVPIIQWLGFLLGSFLFLVLLMARLKVGWLKSIVISAILILLTAWMFEKVFLVTFPIGVFKVTF